MTEKKKLVIYIIMGLCSGLTSFALIELISDSGIKSYLHLSLLQGAFLGLCFGFIFGFSDGILYKELKSGLLKAGISAAAGALIAAAAQIAASQAMLVTSNLFNADYNKSIDIILPLWRSAGWMLMGMTIGAIDGIMKRTARRAAAGLLGGLAGGLSGGLVFEFITRLFPDNFIIRIFGLLIMGVLIGFFLGEFERRFSYGRLKILNGRLKDREYLLIKRKTLIGSKIRDDIYLHSYKTITDGTLIKDRDEVYFEPEKASENVEAADVTMLNDRPLNERKYLKYQDVIQLGSIKLLYLPS